MYELQSESFARGFLRTIMHRSPTQWSQYLHACMDNKVFQVLPNAKFRRVAAKRAIRGVYRQRKRDYSVGHVKPSNPKVRGRCKSDTSPGPDVARPDVAGLVAMVFLSAGRRYHMNRQVALNGLTMASQWPHNGHLYFYKWPPFLVFFKEI